MLHFHFARLAGRLGVMLARGGRAALLWKYVGSVGSASRATPTISDPQNASSLTGVMGCRWLSSGDNADCSRGFQGLPMRLCKLPEKISPRTKSLFRGKSGKVYARRREEADFKVLAKGGLLDRSKFA